MAEWMTMEFWDLGVIALSALFMVLAIIVLSRVFGLRSFSKLSGFDFAITIAFGSVLAGTIITKNPPVAQGATALLFLFVVQWAIAHARRRWNWASRLINNEPRLVWYDGEFFEDNMSAAQITRADIIAKFREANAIRMTDVLAVVVETTGDVSVLHNTGDNRAIDPVVMQGVVGWSDKGAG